MRFYILWKYTTSERDFMWSGKWVSLNWLKYCTDHGIVLITVLYWSRYCTDHGIILIAVLYWSRHCVDHGIVLITVLYWSRYYIDHGILLSKLKISGIKGKNLVLYKLYLPNRNIRTAIYSDSDKIGTVCSWGTVRHGVYKALVFFYK
jgi:hypothetical protein